MPVQCAAKLLEAEIGNLDVEGNASWGSMSLGSLVKTNLWPMGLGEFEVHADFKDERCCTPGTCVKALRREIESPQKMRQGRRLEEQSSPVATSPR